MNLKSAKSHAPLKDDSSGFVILPILILIALGAVTVAAKSAYDKQQVLGESSLIAQAPPDGGGAPPPSDGGGSAPPPQESQSAPQPQQSAPQQSAPPQNSAPQPQQNQAPQPGSGTNPSNPQPGTGQGGPAGTNPGGGQQYQPKTQAEQRQYQQYQQQSPEQQNRQAYPRNEQPGEQQRTQPSGQNGSPGQNQQYPGTGGTGQGGQPNNQQNQNVYTPQLSEKQYQQFQQQYEQEAGKYGFQINGSLPPQFLDRQNPQGQNNTGQNGQPGQQGQGGQTAQGTGQGPQNQNPQNFFSSFQALPTLDSFPTIQGNFTVNGSGGKNVNLNDGNTRIQLWGQGPNSPLTAFGPDGSQVQIDKAEFEKINAAMKLTTGSEVTQNGNNFSLRRGQVEAQTNLPISFNVATKSFTVQTASGEQEVKFLPDEVTQKLLENKVFSQLQTETVTGEEGTTETQATVSLTELDNKPVYEVQGASRQRFLGFAPVSISKTVYVSAETGDQVKTQQPFTSQLLDLISF